MDPSRLSLEVFPKWQILARRSREEQGVPRLDYVHKPFHPGRLIWVMFADDEPIGYLYVQDALPVTRHPSFEQHPEYHSLRFMLSDLYVLHQHRRGGIARDLITAALRELGVADDEPVALLLPVSEDALTALPRILGSRRFVGSKRWGSPIFGAVEEIAAASRRLKAAIKRQKEDGT